MPKSDQHRVRITVKDGVYTVVGKAEAAAGVAATPSPLVLVLLGKIGQGKSSLGNACLGFSAYESRRAAASVTHSCAIETLGPEVAAGRLGSSAGRRGLVVIDTPGLGDPSMPEGTLYLNIRKTLDTVERELRGVKRYPW